MSISSRAAEPGRSAVALLAALLLAAGLLLVTPTPARAVETFTVTATADTHDGTCSPAPDHCSLRDAIDAANTTANAGGPDVVVLQANAVYTLEIEDPEPGGDDTTTLDLDVKDDLIIEGNGATIRTEFPSGPDAETRIIEVHDAQLTLRDVTLTGAAVTGDGGAVYLSGGSLEAEDVTISDNTATNAGGGIGTDDYESIHLTRVLIEGNSVDGSGSGQGGGIEANAADDTSTFTIERSTVRDNYAATDAMGFSSTGAGIRARGGTVTIADSLIESNGDDDTGPRTALGGGLHGEDTLLGVVNSSFVDNVATAGGGGAYIFGGGAHTLDRVAFTGNAGGDGGGGLLAFVSSNLVVRNGTISGNSVDSGGSGIQLYPGPAMTPPQPRLEHVTIVGNAGGPQIVTSGVSLSVRASLLDGTTASACSGDPLVSLGHNVETTNDCGLSQPTDHADTPLGVDGLAPNPVASTVGQGVDGTHITHTHALLPGSVARDAIPTSADCDPSVHVDQRNLMRPQNGACDIGAYEAVAGSPPPPPPPPPPSDDVPIDRIDGSDRIETSVEVSQEVFGDGEAGAVVLTRADDFPDAQAGAPLAVDRDAPILLTAPAALHPVTEAEIVRVLPEGGTVYLLGGTVALSEAVEDRLVELGFEVVRLGGVNRFATAAIIAGEGLGHPAVLLATNGGDFADSVVAGAAAPAAAAGGAALILTSGTDVPAETQAYLDALDAPPTIIAVGGAAAEAFPDADEALVGTTRFETALAVADAFYTEPTVVGVATGLDFADALTGGAVIGRDDVGPGPMLLTDRDTLPDSVAEYLEQHAATLERVVLFGGEAAISAAVEDAIDAILGT